MNQTQLNDAFWQAVHDERFDEAGQFLSQGANIEEVNMRGQTAFLLYAAERKMNKAEWLFNHGANINAKDRQGRTALHSLVETTIATRDLRTLDEFLVWRPSLDEQDRQGVTPLTQASISRRGDEVVNRLLDAGANPNVVPISGSSALLGAAANAYEKTVMALLDKNANPNQVDHDGKTLLHALVSSFDAELLAKVLALQLPIDINQTSRSGATPLSSSVDLGDVHSAAELLKAGADPNIRSTNRFGMGATALQLMILAQPVEGAKNLLGAKKGREKEESINKEDKVDDAAHDNLVEIAIASGADVWAVDAEGRNAWHYLGMRQTFSKSIFDLLVKEGLPMDESTGPGGRNPLRAVFDQPIKPYDRQVAIDHMIGAGFPADPPFVELSTEYKDNNPEEAENKVLSPLAAAVLTRARFEVEQLLDAGANPNRLDDSGLSPLHRAITLEVRQQEQMAVQMMAMSGKSKDPVQQMEGIARVVKDTRLWTIGKLMAHGGDPMTEDASPQKKTPFMLAIDMERPEIISYFLQQGADPLKANSVGDYPVLEALTHGKLAIFYALVNHVREQGREAELSSILIDAALTSPEKWDIRMPFLEVLRTLDEVEWVNYQDAEGNTPLIIAAATGQEDLVDILLARSAKPDVKNKNGETAIMHAINEEKGDIIRSLRQFGATTQDVNPDGISVENMAHATHHRHVIKSVVGPLEPNPELADFVKPNPATLESMEKIPDFVKEFKEPIVLMDDPARAEAPKEDPNAPAKKKGMFGF